MDLDLTALSIMILPESPPSSLLSVVVVTSGTKHSGTMSAI